LCSVGSGGCGLPSLGFGLVLPSSKSYKKHFTTTGLLSPNIADYRTSTDVKANQVSYQSEKSVSPWPQTQKMIYAEARQAALDNSLIHAACCCTRRSQEPDDSFKAALNIIFLTVHRMVY